MNYILFILLFSPGSSAPEAAFSFTGYTKQSCEAWVSEHPMTPELAAVLEKRMYCLPENRVFVVKQPRPGL